MTPSVSGKCSPAELITRVVLPKHRCRRGSCDNEFTAEVGTGFEPVYTALQAVASPLGHPTETAIGVHRADDGIRTRDPHLGKVMRYQLRHVRLLALPRSRAILSDPDGRSKLVDGTWHCPVRAACTRKPSSRALGCGRGFRLGSDVVTDVAAAIEVG